MTLCYPQEMYPLQIILLISLGQACGVPILLEADLVARVAAEHWDSVRDVVL